MTFYAIRPDPVTGSLDNAEVMSELRYGWQFLEQAIMLWRLVDPARADETEAIKASASRAAGDGEIRFHAPELRELVRLLAGIDEAFIAAGIVDAHWRVPPEHLEELAKRVPAMDLQTERPLHAKTNALAEVMINAVSVRDFLANALAAGCVVVFS